MIEVPLFPGYEPPPVELVEQLSADARRTLRQARDVANGVHPLTGGKLHPLASTARDAQSPKRDPFTCGSCLFRIVKGGTSGRYVKCYAQDGRWITGGPATDVRAWWPACPEYSPGDMGLSPDAARSFPT